jgi:hypothetical protein
MSSLGFPWLKAVMGGLGLINAEPKRILDNGQAQCSHNATSWAVRGSLTPQTATLTAGAPLPRQGVPRRFRSAIGVIHRPGIALASS